LRGDPTGRTILVSGESGSFSRRSSVGKYQKMTPEEEAAQKERSRRFYEILERRRAQDEELKAAREQRERPERPN